MASYFQTTIHSKNSKYEKSNRDGMGRLIKGVASTSKGNRSISMYADSKQYKHFANIFDDQAQENKGIQINDEDVSQTQIQAQNNSRNSKIRDIIQNSRQVVHNTKQLSNSKALVGQSDIFPAIFFKKTTMRSILKQFLFPENCKALLPNDQKTPLIFQIVGNLFNQITFFIFNLLIGVNNLSKSYYIFFSDSQSMPFTKCCNMPAFVELHSNGTGQILCNSKNCQHPSLAQFLVSYEDSSKLWPDMTYLQQASEIDRDMKVQICKYIKTGKYRKNKLQNIINNTSKRVQNFYETSNNNFKNDSNAQFAQTPFLTGIQKQNKSRDQSRQSVASCINEQQVLQSQEKDTDILKLKLQYMNKRQKSLHKRMVKGLVEEGKVFNKKFEMMQKLDELMQQNTGNKTLTKMTFPKLMAKLRVRQQIKMRGGKTRNQSFMN